MPSVKLRKRRPTTGHNDSLLPQYTTATTAQGGRLAGGRAKRRRRPRSYTRLGIACLGFLLVVLLLVWDPVWLPTPQHPAVHRARAYTKKKVSSVLDKVQRQQHRRHSSSNASYERITCADGSGTTGYLNDDYCDCADGSDEQTTAACAHVLLAVPHFVCHNNATIKMYASRVRDGVRDCPDGSDEF
jgi:hypothetical protein